MLVSMTNILTSCGDSNEYFDEHTVHRTRTRSYSDNRMEIALPGNHTSEAITLLPGVTAKIEMSWRGNFDVDVSANCIISIDSTDVYTTLQNYEVYAHIHDFKAMAKFYVEIQRHDKDTSFIAYSRYVEEKVNVEREWYDPNINK